MEDCLLANYLDRITHFFEAPTLYGTPELAEGMALGLAASWYCHAGKVSLDVACRWVFDLARGACKDVERLQSVGVFLCSEAVLPESRTSYDALRRHGT